MWHLEHEMAETFNAGIALVGISYLLGNSVVITFQTSERF